MTLDVSGIGSPNTYFVVLIIILVMIFATSIFTYVQSGQFLEILQAQSEIETGLISRIDELLNRMEVQQNGNGSQN